MGRKLVSAVVAYVTLLLGAVILGFPAVATVLNNYADGVFASARVETIKHLDKGVLAREVKDAGEYNKHIVGMPLVDPWLHQDSPEVSEQYRKYQSELRFGGSSDPMGFIEIPRIKVYLPIYHGTSDEVLSRGVGHLFGTSLPVGGRGTNSVLTGHTGFSRKTLFDQITQLEHGDLVKIFVANQILYYQVDSHKVVLPTETDDLLVRNSDDRLTLITCYPYAQNTHRWLVFARRVAAPKDVSDGPVILAPSLWQVVVAAPLWVKGLSLLSVLVFVSVLVSALHQVLMFSAGYRGSLFGWHNV